MLNTTIALAPTFILILIGWLCRNRGFLSDAFWLGCEKLTYFILFPALLVANLAEANLSGLPVWEIAAANIAAITLMGAVALITKPLLARWPFHYTDQGFTSLFQGIMRPNTYIGLGVATALFGSMGTTVTAICVAIVVPYVNFLCVMILVRYGEGDHNRGLKGMIMPIVKNPLIIACAIGAVLNMTGIGLPIVIGPVLKTLGQASLAFGLLAVGAGLSFKHVKSAAGQMIFTSLLKLLLLPTVVGGIGILLGVGGTALVVMILYAALPVAANSYILARQMGGDATAMASIITISTPMAAFTIALVLHLAQKLV